MKAMTYSEVISRGYITADSKYQRGYISRKADHGTQPVLTAGGNRQGAKVRPASGREQHAVLHQAVSARDYLTVRISDVSVTVRPIMRTGRKIQRRLYIWHTTLTVSE